MTDLDSAVDPTTGQDAGSGPRIPALRNGVALLRYLASKPSPVPASAISRRLGIPRSSTYQLLQVLIDEGLVVHIPDAQGYKLGIGIFELGSAYLRHQPLEHLARPILATLVRRLRVTVHLGILYGHESLYLLKEQPPRPTKLVTEVGVRLPAHLTATGRAMLCLLPDPQVSAVFSTPDRFVDRTGRGPQNLRELRSVLEVDRARGWSIEDGSITDGVACVAAAATDHNGMPVASFSASFLTADVPRERWEGFGASLRESAAELTRRLGG
ncbi:IclR family transcriptional regulator [Planctomonas psychrotolerans]|uniref:IclR family transcriptional regulator n=1 Tax=Planctomonas psychrotolerans TaxID=2528712 RepID=UPI0012387E08|nr:IclR family transcriptional regulator [Planctomonas psychrotolerans]